MIKKKGKKNKGTCFSRHVGIESRFSVLVLLTTNTRAGMGIASMIEPVVVFSL